MHKLFHFLLLFLIWVPLATAQDSYLKKDSDSSEVRIPTEQRLQEIAEDDRYAYNEEIVNPTLWQRFLTWLNSKLRDWFSVGWVEWLLKGISIIAFILVIFLIINQISKGEFKNALMRRQNRTFLDLRLNNKEADNSQLDELIEQAIRKKQYGLAVRYLYQKALFLLREGELIQWKQDKTNHDYLQELGNHPTASSFDRLTYFHDYVDYGDFPIDEPRFLVVQKVYQQFVNDINQKS